MQNKSQFLESFYSVPSDDITTMFMLFLLAGVTNGAYQQIPWAMYPDFMDSTRINQQQSIEGAFSAFWLFGQKIANALAPGFLNEKYCAVNIGKLFEKKPYVEYRALGGKNYHWKINDIVKAIREFSKAMDMSLGGRYDYLVKRYIKNMAGIVDSQPTFIPH